MKQTAVEWLEQTINSSVNAMLQGNRNDVRKAFKTAKEMEKQQIVDAFDIGYQNGACVNDGENIYHGTNYYKKNFKNK